MSKKHEHQSKEKSEHHHEEKPVSLRKQRVRYHGKSYVWDWVMEQGGDRSWERIHSDNSCNFLNRKKDRHLIKRLEQLVSEEEHRQDKKAHADFDKLRLYRGEEVYEWKKDHLRREDRSFKHNDRWYRLDKHGKRVAEMGETAAAKLEHIRDRLEREQVPKVEEVYEREDESRKETSEILAEHAPKRKSATVESKDAPEADAKRDKHGSLKVKSYNGKFFFTFRATKYNEEKKTHRIHLFVAGKPKWYDVDKPMYLDFAWDTIRKLSKKDFQALVERYQNS